MELVYNQNVIISGIRGKIVIQSDRCQIKEFIYQIGKLLKNNNTLISEESCLLQFLYFIHICILVQTNADNIKARDKERNINPATRSVEHLVYPFPTQLVNYADIYPVCRRME
jgi:hypothetical protein